LQDDWRDATAFRSKEAAAIARIGKALATAIDPLQIVRVPDAVQVAHFAFPILKVSTTLKGEWHYKQCDGNCLRFDE
jgi:hypothetical protein